jgi:hypothetical protein
LEKVVEAIEPNWVSLIVFAAAWGVACVGAFYLVGIMPLAAAPGAVQRGAGPLLVMVTCVLVVVLVASALVFAISELRWSSLVIAGGMVFLFAPFIVQDLPPALKDNKLGLVLVMVLSLGGLALLYASGLVPIMKGFIV